MPLLVRYAEVVETTCDVGDDGVDRRVGSFDRCVRGPRGQRVAHLIELDRGTQKAHEPVRRLSGFRGLNGLPEGRSVFGECRLLRAERELDPSDQIENVADPLRLGLRVPRAARRASSSRRPEVARRTRSAPPTQ